MTWTALKGKLLEWFKPKNCGPVQQDKLDNVPQKGRVLEYIMEFGGLVRTVEEMDELGKVQAFKRSAMVSLKKAIG